MKSLLSMNNARIFIGTIFLVLLWGCESQTFSDASTPTAEVNASVRERFSFNDNWRFLKADTVGAEQPGFDDKHWRLLRLPHDWAIEVPFDRKHGARTGGLPVYGIAWYRKNFLLPAHAQGRLVSVEFDGAMYNAEVWINGHYLGKRPNGYIGFQYDLSPYLNYNGNNTIAVKLSPEELSSRWYPGAGLYRNTWLHIKNPIHVAHWGTRVTTDSVSQEQASVQLTTQIQHTLTQDALIQDPFTQDTSIHVITRLLNPQGHEVARSITPVIIAANSQEKLTQENLTQEKVTQTKVIRTKVIRTKVTQIMQVKNPALWELTTPNLHKAITELHHNGKVLDRYETRFGIRSISYTPEGFFLNGKPLRFKGVCMHHDLGALGAAVNRRATERQLDMMKSMGANAIRTSHNPPSPELVQLAEEKGILLQVEAFDVWEIAKVPNGMSVTCAT
jgi:beta-galactosidase